MHAVVLVLGDVGRSPRMQYHALSLAAESAVTRVSLVGLTGERCMPAVEAQSKIQTVLIQPPSVRLQKLPRAFFPLYALIKILWQVAQLMLLLLWTLPRADVVLVQNPPCIPTFVVTWLACRVRGGALVIDWHNLGYTILGITLHGTASAWLVGVARAYEKYCGRLADQHLCVTDALRSWLISDFGLAPERVTVLHDQAPEHFARLSPPERHELFTKLDEHFRWPELGLDRKSVQQDQLGDDSTETESELQGTYA
jgi:beta-1,4-mannosyltransferase